MNYRSVVLATSILIGENSSTSCLGARNLDEKSRDCNQRIGRLLNYTKIQWAQSP